MLTILLLYVDLLPLNRMLMQDWASVSSLASSKLEKTTESLQMFDAPARALSDDEYLVIPILDDIQP
jgi:putative heme degradation protein